MFSDNKISAVLVSADLEVSQDFYKNKVGLTLSPETMKNHLVFDCGNGTSMLIYGRGTGNTADHTQVRFWSTDVDKDVAELEDSRFVGVLTAELRTRCRQQPVCRS